MCFRRKGKLFSKIPVCKYYFETKYLKKKQFAGKGATTPFFAVLSSDLKHIFFHKKTVKLITVLHFLT